ncbi:HNH endonuclease [[Kitasatospora] papulosa]|uniref:HNH endonuclease n=1 Tax=[Kitasatospora] papulosa TaxID=1464011 RepID=UPI00368E11F5
MRNGHPLNAARRRARKEQLARRHGWRCTYCRRPFVTLREATLDHVVPHSLFRTWSVVHLVLACRPCNHAKADRLPLSLALLIAWTYGPDLRDDPRHTHRHTAPQNEAFTADQPVFTKPDRSGDRGPLRLAPGDVRWLLLAHLVQARSGADQSTPEQAKQRKNARRSVRVGRLAHQRRTPRLNTCEQPTDRGVSA